MILLLNAFVDPFGILGVPEIQGFNRIKPKMSLHMRMVKAHKINKIKPKGLILGSSRAEVGLDPEHPGWSKNAHPIYNAALPSARIMEIFQYLRHAHSQASIAQVVLGLDFFSFDVGWKSESGFDAERLNSEPGFLPRTGVVKDIITGLFSYDSLHASIDTLRHQDKPIYGYLNNGSRDVKYRQQQIVKKGGHFEVFQAVLTSAITAEDGMIRFDYGHDNGKKTEVLGWFRELVLFCVKEEIEIFVLISPLHSQRLELIWQLGLWETFEQWKRDVTQIIDETKEMTSRQKTIELWDFSGFNRISMESVPKQKDISKKMTWYWEASHYKKKTGNLMLDKVLLGKKVEDAPEFGFKLSMAEIESHLQFIRRQRKIYLKTRPEDVKYIETLINDTLHL